MARLARRRDWDEVFRRGRSYATPLMVVRYLRGDGPARVAVTVSRGLGTAVRRNRLRRRWREVVRLGPRLGDGWRVVVVARPASEGATPVALREAWAEAVRRCRLAP
jgi:ribonuclease P protein component